MFDYHRIFVLIVECWHVFNFDELSKSLLISQRNVLRMESYYSFKEVSNDLFVQSFFHDCPNERH